MGLLYEGCGKEPETRHFVAIVRERANIQAEGISFKSNSTLLIPI